MKLFQTMHDMGSILGMEGKKIVVLWIAKIMCVNDGI